MCKRKTCLICRKYFISVVPITIYCFHYVFNSLHQTCNYLVDLGDGKAPTERFQCQLEVTFYEPLSAIWHSHWHTLKRCQLGLHLETMLTRENYKFHAAVYGIVPSWDSVIGHGCLQYSWCHVDNYWGQPRLIDIMIKLSVRISIVKTNHF